MLLPAGLGSAFLLLRRVVSMSMRRFLRPQALQTRAELQPSTRRHTGVLSVPQMLHLCARSGA